MDPFSEQVPVIPPLKWYQRWWVIMLLIIFIVMLIIALGFGLTVWYFKKNIEQGKFYDPSSGKFVTELTVAPSSIAGKKQEVSVDNNPTLGYGETAVTIISFEDFACPYSAQAEPIIRSIMNTYKDQALFVYRHFPSSELDGSISKSALASECANAQGKFWEYHDALFVHQSNLDVDSLKKYAAEIGLNKANFNDCLDQSKYQNEVEKDIHEGLALSISGTPTWFINGVKYQGVLSEKNFEDIINAEIKYKK